ncbi:hypothetical protein [Hyalangium gracile]|uniref:hypothetical protein n=1 Tax=Hyalangium gracile TaxID=394092 RepID=UPI001CD020AA|nr:hypothetical protein [Hyalangium gracile]
MRDIRDQRDLARLGLMVLVYGLVVAPVLHAVEGHAGGWKLPATSQGWLDHQRTSAPRHEREAAGHEHGHEHGDAHGDAAGHEPGKGHAHRHQLGSVEHLTAVAVARAVVLAPQVWWLPLRAEVTRSPEWVSVAPLRPTAMPQGP